MNIRVSERSSFRLRALRFGKLTNFEFQECKSGYTILHEAVKCGNTALVSSILRHEGIDVERKNYERLTPYQLADEYPYVGKLLLEHGALRIAKSDDSDDDYSSDEDEFDSHPSDSVTVGVRNLKRETRDEFDEKS